MQTITVTYTTCCIKIVVNGNEIFICYYFFFVVIRAQGLFYWRTEVNVTIPQPSFLSFKSIIENPNMRVNILNFVFINFKVLHADLLPSKIYSSIYFRS